MTFNEEQIQAIEWFRGPLLVLGTPGSGKQWDAIYTKEKREELYKKEKSSHTIVKPPKVGRNDPCPCGSGKKYKKCCGANL